MHAYLEAGADVGFVEAPQTVEEMARIPGSFTKPALVNIFEGGKTPPLPAKRLEEMGFRIGIYPSQTHRAAIFGAMEVLAVLKRDGDTTAMEPRMVTFQDREKAVNSAYWRGLERKYMAEG
jgi:2-methylisocitrate lyase-like PEP mutase family enzyme